MFTIEFYRINHTFYAVLLISYVIDACQLFLYTKKVFISVIYTNDVSNLIVPLRYASVFLLNINFTVIDSVEGIMCYIYIYIGLGVRCKNN